MKLLVRTHYSSSLRHTTVLLLTLLLFHQPAVGMDREWLYTVEDGDNLWTLSKEHLKSMRYWKKLVVLNNIEEPYRLQPGTALRIPVEWLKSGSSVATIVELTGEATIAGHTSDQLVPAQKGMLLWEGDTIKTVSGSNATLQFTDGSRILVQAESELKVEKLVGYGSTGMADTKVRLKSGRTHNKVIPKTKQGSRFEISTPSAIAAVRGTEYRISAEENGESRTEVLTGAVGVDSSGSSQVVPEGFGTVSYRDRKPLEPVRLLPPPDLSGAPKTIYRVPFSLDLLPLEGASQFRLQIAPDDTFITLLFDSTFPTSNIWVPDLPDNTYFLRVSGIDDNGLEGLYSFHPLSIEARPLPPLQIQPPAKAVLDQPRVTFQWSKPQDVTHYRFQLSGSSQFEQPLIADETDLDTTIVTPDHELKPGVYHWRVASVSSEGKVGPFSDPQEFRRTPAQPDMSGAEMDTGELVFRWQQGEPEQTFRFQMSRDLNFSELLIDEELTDSFYSLKQFDYGSYYIRIAITGADGYRGPFGPYQTVEIPPPPPHPLSFIIPAIITLIVIL